jgi:hypothetical protein
VRKPLLVVGTSSIAVLFCYGTANLELLDGRKQSQRFVALPQGLNESITQFRHGAVLLAFPLHHSSRSLSG